MQISLSIARLSLAALLVATAATQTKEAKEPPPVAAAPKQVGLSELQQQAVQLFTERANRLDQEARAVAAERANLSAEIQQAMKQWCEQAGGSSCTPHVQDADPRKWTLAIDKPVPPVEPPKK